MSPYQDIYCPKCGKVCARRYPGYIEIKEKQSTRHYGPGPVVIDCGGRDCGKTFDVPGVGYDKGKTRI